MPNISITRRCKRCCPYCFAMSERKRTGILDMTPNVYDRTLAFLRRSGIPDVRLLGGEPTEHPAFGRFVDLAISRGFAVTVFTGGLLDDGTLACLSDIAPDRINVVLNSVAPGDDPAAWVKAQEHTCSVLGSRVELGITIYSPGFASGHLIDWIGKYGLRRRLRVGLAHPIWGGSNTSLRQQSAHSIGPMVERFVGELEAAGVEIDFDCGFMPCIFSARFLEDHPHFSGAIGPRCDSIIDILPEGFAIPCYALSQFRRLPLTDNVTRDDLVLKFDEELRQLLPVGIFRSCTCCEHRTVGRCNGGCRARRALRLRPDALRPLAPDGREKQ